MSVILLAISKFYHVTGGLIFLQGISVAGSKSQILSSKDCDSASIERDW